MEEEHNDKTCNDCIYFDDIGECRLHQIVRHFLDETCEKFKLDPIMEELKS